MKCLHSLREQFSEPPLGGSVDVRVVLVDDGSSDGTGDAVRREFPDTIVLEGDGQLFWGGGMHKAFAEAMKFNPDYYLWLNDDTELLSGSLVSMLTFISGLAEKGQANSILTGATCSKETGETTYGGVVSKHRWWPLQYRVVEPAGKPIECDTINGNCVLIPKTVADKVGNIDLTFAHYLADHDYGYRARQQGATLWLSDKHIGYCELSAPERRGRKKISFREALSRLKTPKGLPIGDVDLTPFKEWKEYSRRYGGRLWPIYFLAPYRRLLPLLWNR